LFAERSFHNSYLTVLGIRLFLRGPIIRFQWQLIEVRLYPFSSYLVGAWDADAKAPTEDTPA